MPGLVTVVFDDRERDLHRTFAALATDRADLAARLERLPMGDVFLSGGPGTPCVVVERKRVSDLMASRVDGRLAEQLQRMHAWQADQPGSWLCVVVEGTSSVLSFRKAPDPQAQYRWFLKTYLEAAAAHTQGGGGRRLLLRTCGEQETALLLLTLHKTLCGDGAALLVETVADLPRKRHALPFVRQLCGTEGVSPARAGRVATHYASVRHLLAEWGADPAGTRARLVAAVGGDRVAARLLADLGVEGAEGALRALRPRRSRARGRPEDHLGEQHGREQLHRAPVDVARAGVVDMETDPQEDHHVGHQLAPPHQLVERGVVHGAHEPEGVDAPHHEGEDQGHAPEAERRGPGT